VCQRKRRTPEKGGKAIVPALGAQVLLMLDMQAQI
jgi:hypothetical protein